MALQGEISSSQNRHILLARSLHRKRARDREQLCLIEGVRLVETSLDARAEPVFCFIEQGFATDDRRRALVERLLAGPWPSWWVTDGVMEALADTQTPQGVACVMPVPSPATSLASEDTLAVILDGIRDPGNLGTIMRTCHALGVPSVLMTKDCVDPWAPKVVRAGMGAHFYLSVWADRDWRQIDALTAHLTRVVSQSDAAKASWELDWTQPIALIIGGEARGASGRAHDLAEERVSIPMAGGAESLNAAIACGMFLYETLRQRAQAQDPCVRSRASIRS